MKINIIATFDIDKDESELFTPKEIEDIYSDFREMIAEVHRTQDLSLFTFINTDTGMQIEDEINQ